MPIRGLTVYEERFLNVLFLNGFGEENMRQVIDNPSLIDDIKNLLISKKFRQRNLIESGNASGIMLVDNYGLPTDVELPLFYESSMPCGSSNPEASHPSFIDEECLM